MGKPTGSDIIVFAGTSEGRLLYQFCADWGIRAVFCVATEYGRQVLCRAETARRQETETVRRQEAETGNETIWDTGGAGPVIRVGRMEEAEMLTLFLEEKPVMIIDATHPYAVEATAHIKTAAKRYRQDSQIQECVYYRVLRSLSEAESMTQKETGVIYCADMEQAVAYLNHTAGNILVTTGSKQLDELCKLKEYAARIYLRILPNPDMLQECLKKGFPAEHVICMQGPFSEEMNVAMLHEYNICYMLTKQSGRTGGYPQKMEAARRCGVVPVVIVPPQEADGVSVEEMQEILKKR